jgi:thiosulfate reductase/polysulfide reductase chain A
VILSWLHLLVTRGTYNKEFVENQCTGLPELINHVKDFTPEWAASHAGVAEENIVAAYELMADAMPAVLIHPGRHVAWYGEADTQRSRAQAILSALLGSFWAKGGFFRSFSPVLADFQAPDLPDLPPSVDAAAKRFPFAQEVTTNGIRDATRTGKPYPVKGWFVHGTNLIQSMPSVRETLDAIEQLDTLVVCDIQPTEITKYADILLPEDIFLERDLSEGAGLKSYEPAVVSPSETRPAWRIAKELGTALGVGDQFAFDTFEEYLSARLVPSGTTLDRTKLEGIAFVPPKNQPYLNPFETFHWHTPSGKVELFSKQLEEKGFAPLPIFVPPPDPPSGTVRLLYGRSPQPGGGRTHDGHVPSDLDPANSLWIHPDSARKLGIEGGQCVTVTNSRGATSGSLRTEVTESVMPGTVYMTHGFGHGARCLRRADGMGGSDSDVIARYEVDPISGATGMRTEFVRIQPAERSVSAPGGG